MLQIRPANQRGHANFGWLDTFHTFSFGEYYDPNFTGFRGLRVVNEDTVAPGRGFGTHPHRDMEIVTYVISGALAHKDSLGNGSTIVPGDVQRMSAGTGIQHSEYNASAEVPVHFLQIWLIPHTQGVAPGYEQKTFPLHQRRGGWHLIASPDGQQNSIRVHSNAQIFSTLLSAGERSKLPDTQVRYGWLQVVRGNLSLAEHSLAAGDGVALDSEGSKAVVAHQECELLYFALT